MRSLRKNRKGMTGIEEAIIVIAFVIAASVFAFAILNMGLLTTTKATTTIGTSLDNAQSMEPLAAYAFAPNAASGNDTVTGLAFLVQPYGTGTTDFTQGKITISLTTPSGSFANVYTGNSVFVNNTYFNSQYGGSFTVYLNSDPTNCSIIAVQGSNSTLLSGGEQFAIFINLGTLGCTLSPYDQVTIVLTPTTGAALTETYNIPANVASTMLLTGS